MKMKNLINKIKENGESIGLIAIILVAWGCVMALNIMCISASQERDALAAEMDKIKICYAVAAETSIVPDACRVYLGE